MINISKNKLISFTAVLLLNNITIASNDIDNTLADFDETIQLQWILSVPEQYWSHELNAIAQQLDRAEYQKAKDSLTTWLTNDSEQALLALPHMSQFYFYFNNTDFVSIFAHYLQEFDYRKRFEILAALGLRKTSVRLVGQQILIDWWQQDQNTFQVWLQNTPSFFEDLYLDEFIAAPQHDEADFKSLADLFLSLPATDKRKKRFFNLIIERWLENNPKNAIAYVNDLNISNINAHATLDNVYSTFAYYFNYHKQYHQTLAWAERIQNRQIRETSIRDFCLSLSDKNAVNLFKNWLRKHPIESTYLAAEINKHFSTLITQ